MSGIDLIAARRHALLREKGELSERIRVLEAEEAELDIAERTLSRLQRRAPVQPPTIIVEPDENAHWHSGGIPRRGAPRPEGAPATPAMIEAVLREAAETGKPGLSGKEMVLAIRRRFWPGVGWTPILPEASRLYKAGRIERRVLDGARLYAFKHASDLSEAKESGDGGPVPRQELEPRPRGSTPPVSTSVSTGEEGATPSPNESQNDDLFVGPAEYSVGTEPTRQG